MYKAIYNTLTVEGFGGTIQPELAQSWTVSPNGTVYTFNLVQNATFQDGTPFNATAVQLTFEQCANQSAAGSNIAGDFVYVSAINVLSAYQIQIVLSKPIGYFLQLIADECAPVSPTAVAKYGFSHGQHPVGTGPYMLTSWIPNDQEILVANPNYWGGKPYISKIVVSIVPDESARVLGLETGEYQLIDVTLPSDVPSVLSAGFPVKVEASDDLYMVQLNENTTFGSGAMLNQYLRDAVNYAINRTQVIISASAGFGTVSETLINPAWPWFNASLNSVYPVNGNVTLAKQFLAKSNYARQMLPFVYVDLGNNQIVAETVQADLAAAGINTNLISLNFPSYINTAYGGPGGTHWDLLLNQFSESNTRFRDYYTPGETWDPKLHQQFTAGTATRSRDC